MSGCLPCELEEADASSIVYRDDTWAVEIPTGYEVPGWYFLRLRRHAEGWGGPTPEEMASFGTVSQNLALAIQSATGGPLVYFMTFGENHPHFHFLVIARPVDLPAEYRGAGILAMRADNLDVAASVRLAGEVRAALTPSTH